MNNAQKTHFAQTQNEFAEKKIADAIQILGKELPCSVVSVSGSIVTVKFEVQSGFTLPQVTVPLLGAEYIRYPIQSGCPGVVFSADARLGGVSGLGSGVATLGVPANLAALVFMPIGNVNWSATDDADAIVAYGPNGFILRDTGKNCSIVGDTENTTVTAKTQLKLVVGSASITITNGAIDFEGTITINGESYLGHMHSAVQTGSDNSGPVSP